MTTRFVVFTPTYNRGYILKNAYDSLVNQTYKNFVWIIIDDGSSDNTSELVNGWIVENEISIKYIFQENHGRYSAFNVAKEYFDADLMVPLDSDDYLLSNCLERIAKTWESIDCPMENYSGILSYLETKNGERLGDKIPDELEFARLYELPDRYGVLGDKLEVCRCDLLKKYSYPVFEGEKFTGDTIVYFAVNDEYPEYILREKLGHREYLDDGLTMNTLKHHLGSKKGMREHYRDCLNHEKYNYKLLIKHSIGYIAFSLAANSYKYRSFWDVSHKFLVTIFFPLGLLYYVFLLFSEWRIKQFLS